MTSPRSEGPKGGSVRAPRAWRVLASTAALLLLVATYWALRLAYADHLASSEASADVGRAVGLAPANARYWLRWADLLEQEGGSGGHAIEHAAAASPQDATVWIRAGLAAETERNYARAEKCFLEAARLSRQYEPRWTLANYYFRRGAAVEFWHWTRSALEWAYGDRRPLFELAWEMTRDAPLILRTIPENAPSLSAYLGFLLASNRLAAAPEVAAKLAPVCGKEYLPELLYYTARMIEAQQPEPALAVWNRLCARGLLPYEPVDPARGRLLTNGDFARPPLDTGFDWHVTQTGGIAAVRSESPPFLRLSFSGRQPESCRALAQLTPVLPATAYTLRFGYQTAGIAPETGLRWRVYEGAGRAELAARSPELSSERWKPESVLFKTGATTRWVWLVLDYRRNPGTTRIEGELWLRNVSLEASQ
jgi:hypothetical protein